MRERLGWLMCASLLGALAGCGAPAQQSTPASTLVNFYQDGIDGNVRAMSLLMSPTDSDQIKADVIGNELRTHIDGRHYKTVRNAVIEVTQPGPNGDVRVIGYLTIVTTSGGTVRMALDTHLLQVGKTWYVE